MCCVTLGKFLNLSAPEYPPYKDLASKVLKALGPASSLKQPVLVVHSVTPAAPPQQHSPGGGAPWESDTEPGVLVPNPPGCAPGAELSSLLCTLGTGSLGESLCTGSPLQLLGGPARQRGPAGSGVGGGAQAQDVHVLVWQDDGHGAGETAEGQGLARLCCREAVQPPSRAESPETGEAAPSGVRAQVCACRAPSASHRVPRDLQEPHCVTCHCPLFQKNVLVREIFPRKCQKTGQVVA